MHNLAVLYAEGVEGKPDYASAAQWFRKAAEHGVADSQYNLGVLSARGLGTEQEHCGILQMVRAWPPPRATRKPPGSATTSPPIWMPQTLAAAQQAVKSFHADAAARRGHPDHRAAGRLGPR